MDNKNKIVLLYPLTKLYIALLIMVATVVLPGIWSKVICFIVLNFIAVFSGSWKVFINRVKNSVGILFILMIIIQTFFYPSGKVMFSFLGFTAKYEGLLFAINLGFIILCVGGSLIWFFTVTKEKDFVLALEKKGLSPKASYVVLSTLQMVPVMKKKSQTIMNAQKARGVETEGSLLVRIKVFIPTLVPLVLTSIAGIEERALTLEARGFSSNKQHTYLYNIEEKSIDKTINIILIAGMVALVAGRIILWLI